MQILNFNLVFGIILINCSVTVLSSSSLQIEWNVPQFVTSVIFVLASYLSQFIKITVGETFLWKDFLSALCFKCFCSRDRNIFRVRPSRNYAPNLPYSYTKSTQNPSGQMYPGLQHNNNKNVWKLWKTKHIYYIFHFVHFSLWLWQCIFVCEADVEVPMMLSVS